MVNFNVLFILLQFKKKGGKKRAFASLEVFQRRKRHLNVPKYSITLYILGSQVYFFVPALYYMMKCICSFHIFHGELERCFVTLHHCDGGCWCWHARSPLLLGFPIWWHFSILCTRWSSRLVLNGVNMPHLGVWHLLHALSLFLCWPN